MYKIVRSDVSLNDLEFRVNQACFEGFEPSGGPYKDKSSGQWHQAMHKKGKPAKPGEVQLRETKGATA